MNLIVLSQVGVQKKFRLEVLNVRTVPCSNNTNDDSKITLELWRFYKGNDSRLMIFVSKTIYQRHFKLDMWIVEISRPRFDWIRAPSGEHQNKSFHQNRSFIILKVCSTSSVESDRFPHAGVEVWIFAENLSEAETFRKCWISTCQILM